MKFNKDSVNRVVLIFSIAIAAIAKCTAQEVEQIGAYPVSTTDPATLENRPTFPVNRREIDPVTRRLTFQYEAVSERSTWTLKKSLVRAIVPTVWGGIAGFSGAVSEVVIFRREKLFDKYPDLNAQYWDYTISWQNKKLWGAARDAHHDFARLESLFMGGIGASIAFPICHNYKHQKRWQTALDIGAMFAASFFSYSAINTLTWHQFD